MTATMPQAWELKSCRLYRFRVYHPDDMLLPVEARRVVLGYVGETLRMPLARLIEHLYDQPWADTIVGWEVDPREFIGKTAVLKAEAEAIRDEKPLYNVKGNERNDKRIIPPDAIRQRRARDAAAGAGRWAHPDDRSPGVARAPRVQAPRPNRRWTSGQRRFVAWSTGWMVVTVTGWTTLVWRWNFIAWWHPAAIASGVALMLTVWLWSGAPITRRQRRRALRKLRGKRR
jgi:hypothetical protein